MKQGQFFSFFVPIFLILLSSCSNISSGKASLLLSFKRSVQDAEDFKKWISVLKERGGQNGEVNFVFDNDELKAYILTDHEFLSSLAGVKGKNNFSCPERSKYCSICINMKDMSVGCKQGKEDELGSERGLVASTQKVTLRDIIVAGEKKRETRIVFSGMPAEVMFNRSLPHKCKNFVSHVMKSLSLAPKKRRDVSCVTDKKEVVCQALVNVRKI